MAVVVMALLDCKRGRNFGAGVKKQLCVELVNGFRDWRNEVGRLQKGIYSSMHPRLLWSKEFDGQLVLTGPKLTSPYSGGVPVEGRLYNRGLLQ